MEKIIKHICLICAVLTVCSAKASHQLIFEPQSSNLIFAFCFNSFNQIVPNCNVTLSNGYFFTPAQHNHSNPSPPVSQLIPTFGNTGTTGLPVLVNTTEVGQLEGIIVCADLCTLTENWVAYTDLVELFAGSDWVLIGWTPEHNNNHFGLSTTLSSIQAVATQYRNEFPNNPIIGINDIALPVGGKFDLNFNWVGSHFNHSRGKAVDIRGNPLNPNSVPRIPSVQARFEQICAENGANFIKHEFAGEIHEHFHCEWP